VTSKPPYRLPTMRQVRRRKFNGLTVTSTFSGAGGSCLGFRMAGFRTVWASEFVEAARETYAANFPDVPIDPRDVREISGDDVRRAAGLDAFDVLEGSPPCSPYSVAGKRERHWGEVRRYSDREQRVDDLVDEYVRLLCEIRPRALVFENVAGLAVGKAKGYLLRLFADLDGAGYVAEARLLDAQWLGVPQRRVRTVLVGFRKDLGLAPTFPRPLPYRYGLEEAFEGLPAAPAASVALEGPYAQRDASEGIEGYAIGREWRRLRQGESSDRYFNLVRAKTSEPSPTVTAVGGHAGTAAVVHPTEPRKYTIAELRRVCGFPDDFVLTGTYSQQWERLGRAVPPPMMAAVAREIAKALRT